MKNKLVISLLLIFAFIGLFYFMDDKKEVKSNSNIDKSKTYEVVSQNDLILDGIVEVDSIKNLEFTKPENLLVANGDRVDEGERIYSTGYLAPITGIFIINDDASYSIASEKQYISSEIVETDKDMVNQGMKLKVTNLEGTKTFSDCNLNRISVLPTNKEDKISLYSLRISISGANPGQHMKIFVKNTQVIIPKEFIDEGKLLMKNPNSEKWETKEVSLSNISGITYAPISQVPVGTMLKETK
jgi:hypothetical protein